MTAMFQKAYIWGMTSPEATLEKGLKKTGIHIKLTDLCVAVVKILHLLFSCASQLMSPVTMHMCMF